MESLRNHPLILPLYLPSFLYAAAYGMLIPVLPLYAGQLTTLYVLIGLLLASDSIGKMIGDIPAGVLLQRIGMKRTMLLGLGTVAGAMLLLFAATTAWQAMVLLLVSGVGAALYNISRHAYLSVAVRNDRRGRSIALFGGIYRIGKFVGPLLGGWIAASYGLRAPFPVYAVLSLAASVVVLVCMSRVEPGEPLRRAHPDVLATVREHRHIFAAAGSGQILAQITRQGAIAIIPLYAERVLGLDVGTIGVIVSISAAVDVLFFYPAGIIMDRLGRKLAIVPTFAVQGIGLALIPLTDGVVGLTLATCLVGLANGLSSGTMMTLGSDLAPPETRGEFLGVWRLIGDVGFVGGPLLVGVISQVLVLPAAALAIALAGGLTSLTFAWFVPETLQDAPAQQPAGD